MDTKVCPPNNCILQMLRNHNASFRYQYIPHSNIREINTGKYHTHTEWLGYNYMLNIVVAVLTWGNKPVLKLFIWGRTL